MKKNILYITFIIAFSLLSFTPSMAHFGSKGPYGGLVSCMATYDSTVYLGTYTGGVFESTNAQLIAWRPRPVGLKSGNIHALAHTGSYLFAATDSGIYRFSGYVGNDRYWEKVSTGLPSNNVTSLIAIDSITVLAGLDEFGVYKTVNKGASWDSSNVNVVDRDINGFARAIGRIIHISDGGLMASDNDGATWFDYNDVNTGGIDATHISYNSASDEVLVYNTNGLFILSSASTSMSPTYVSATANLGPGVVVKSITNNGSNWYIATNQGIYSSPTGTITWSNQNTGIPAANTTTVIYSPYQNSLVTGTTDKSIYKTPATSISWTAMNTGFNNLATYSMICKDATLIIAATEKGLFRSNDLATTYTSINNGLTDSLHVNDVTFFGSKLLAATTNGGVFFSNDTGSTWSVFNTNLVNTTIFKVVASNNYVYIVNSNREIYQSDLISGWILIQSGLPITVVPTSMDFYNGNIVLGTWGHGIYIRPEGPGAWTQSNSGLTNLNVMAVTVNNQNKMFAGTDGNGVFVSDVSSINWTSTATITNSFTSLIGLDGSKIQSMGYYAGYVFAGFKGSAVASSDNGVTWIEAGTQFNYPSYADMRKLSFVTTRLFATTPNNSLYSQGLSELPTVSINEIDVNSGISIYPNPGKGDFTLNYNNPDERTLMLSIYDALGNELKTFTLPEQKLTLNYPEGIYIMKLTTNKRVVSQKLIIDWK